MSRLAIILFFLALAFDVNAQRCEHKVQRGEDFESIAQKYSITVEELMEANPESKACYVGRKLLIPYHGVAVEHKDPVVEPFDYGLTSSSDKVLTHSSTATYQVGQALLKAKKYDEAHVYLVAAADSGEVRAYYPLGLYYSLEESKNRDNDLAALYFSKAAKEIKDKTQQEYWHSCGYLAEYFLDGKFVEKDLKEAVHYGEDYQRYATGRFKTHAANLLTKIRNEQAAAVRAEKERQAQLKRQQQEEERKRKQVVAQQNQRTTSVQASTQRQSNAVVTSNSNTQQAQATQANQNLQPYTMRNFMGGESTYYPQPDGSVKIHNKTPCVYCHGSRRCSGCQYNAMYNSVASMPRVCPMCFGSTICGRCKGAGFLESWTFLDKSGNGYGVDDRGKVITTAEAKVLNTRVSSSSSSSSSSREEKKQEPLNFIKYGPNYTGETTYKWCDDCKKTVPSEHYHQIVR